MADLESKQNHKPNVTSKEAASVNVVPVTSKKHGPDETLEELIESISGDLYQHIKNTEHMSLDIFKSCINSKKRKNDVGLTEDPIISNDQSYKPNFMSEVVKVMSVTVEDKTTSLLQISQCLLRLERNQTPSENLFPEKEPANNNNLDFGKLGKSFYRLLTGRGLSEDAYQHLVSGNNEKVGKLLSEKDCDDPLTLQDLIEQMISKEDFTIKDVVQHPFFRNKSGKINFICQSFARLVPEDKRTEIDDNKDFIIPKEGWIETLKLSWTETREIKWKRTNIGIDTIYNDAFNKNGTVKYNTHSIFDLLRYFRNQHSHYWEKDDMIQTAFGSYNEGFWDFFHRRFPKLLIHVNRTMIKQFGGDYFSGKVAILKKIGKKIKSPKLQQHKEIDEKLDSLGGILNPPSQDVKLISFPHVSSRQSSFECDDEETRDKTIKKMIKNQTVGEANVIPKLSLIFMDLKKEDIETVSEYLGKDKECKEFEISYNRNIEPVGYKSVGKMVWKNKVKTLRLADCNISDDDLCELFVGMGKAELEVLDISCTSSMTPKGFEYIGELIAKKQIKTSIKLSDLQLDETMLTTFYKHTLGSEAQQVKELNLSYNSTMEPKAYKVLGLFMKLCGVEKLSLAGCGLELEHLKVFRMELNSKNPADETGQYKKMKSLNAGDNTSIGEGISEIAKIVNECQLEELDISECRFSANKLKTFIDDLIKPQKRAEGTIMQLKCLYLGEKRQFDKNYISQVCNLLPHIKEMLRLKGTVCNQLRSELQKELNKLETSELKIKLDNDVTLSCTN